MERITSFSVDHTKLTKGVYVSRIDGELTTFDIRMTTPNLEPALDPRGAHTIEHIGATLLRNGENKDKIIYFGPMGCMTGFYLITKELDLARVIKIVRELFEQIANCGNYSFMDLEKAKAAAKHFVTSEWQHEYHYL